MKQSFNLKELFLGLLGGTLSCLFVIGMLPWQLASAVIGVIIACLCMRYVLKHRPATWFIVGFAAACVFFTLL